MLLYRRHCYLHSDRPLQTCNEHFLLVICSWVSERAV